MIVVFWLENFVPQAVEFKSTEMMDALGLMEHLRKKRRDFKEPISHVCMQSELPESVGEAGVSDRLPVGYDWRKRREDPSTFGRKPNSGDDAEVELG